MHLDSLEPLRSMDWVVENSLTGESAADLLHLLYHMTRDVSFESIWVEALKSEGDWTVNPVLAALLKKIPIRIRTYGLQLGRADMSFTDMEAVCKLVICRGMSVNMNELLRLATEGKRLCRKIDLGLYDLDTLVQVGFCESTLFDHPFSLTNSVLLLQHLITGVPNLRRLVPRIYTSFNSRSSDWPATCPKEEASKVIRQDISGPWGRIRTLRTFDYHYERRNVHSGEQFSIVLRSHTMLEWRVQGNEHLSSAVISLQAVSRG